MQTGIPGYDCFATGIGFRFDEEEARKRIGFFPSVLRHVKGELGGQPFQLEPWQAAIIGNLFGWKEGAAKDAPAGIGSASTLWLARTEKPRSQAESSCASATVTVSQARRFTRQPLTSNRLVSFFSGLRA